MKKKLCATFLTLLALMVFATSVFAAEARWRNVTKITPIILASTNTYSSVINGSEGTTKDRLYAYSLRKESIRNIFRSFPLFFHPLWAKRHIFWYSQH